MCVYATPSAIPLVHDFSICAVAMYVRSPLWLSLRRIGPYDVETTSGVTVGTDPFFDVAAIAPYITRPPSPLKVPTGPARLSSVM